MTTTVIAYFPSPPQGVWHLGPIPLRAYALFIIIGIIAALVIGDRRWAARGGERGVVYDIALWAVPFGLIGGRLYHLATDWRTYFGEGAAGPIAALRIWDGGLGIWGAVALGGVGAWIGCRRRGIPLPAFGDAIAPGIVLAQAIGRIGNYFNQELFGRETTLPWGLEIFYRRDPAGFVDVHSLDGVSTGQLAMVVQPTFLYELLWNLLVFTILIYLDRRFTIGHGRLFAAYVALYCVGRFWVELLRDDTATHIAGIRINSFTSTFVLIGAVVYLILAPKGREDPATLSGSAAELLEPDSLDDADDAAPDAIAAAETTSLVGSGDEDTANADTAVLDEPAVVTETVAADDAAEDDPLDVEAATTTEADDDPLAENDAESAADGDDEETDADRVDDDAAVEGDADEETDTDPDGDGEETDAEAADDGTAANDDAADDGEETDADADNDDEEIDADDAAEVDPPEVGAAATPESDDDPPVDDQAESSSDGDDGEIDDDAGGDDGETEADAADFEAASSDDSDPEPADSNPSKPDHD